MRLKDSLLLGLVSGLLGPVIGIAIFYSVNFRHSPVLQFFQMAARQNLLSPLLSLCAILNLGIFFLFIKVNHLHSARGVIISTFLYGIMIVIFKFLM
ncbi:MAG: hypothetical protein V4658_03250 [Bacteroidota bacterium]